MLTHRNGKYTGDCEGREGGVKLPMLSSPQQALELCNMCVAHAGMPEPCLVLTPSCFVCGHDVLYTCACVFGTHPCVNLLLVFSVRVYICLCV